MKRLLPIAIWTACGAVAALAVWLVWLGPTLRSGRYYFDSSQSVLDAAERRLNNAYRTNRPFLYRWPGAPYGAASGKATEQSTVEEILADVEKADLLWGRSARTLQLRARAHLLDGHYNEAIAGYRSSLLLHPDQTSSKLELGIAYALRAANGPSALDYEFALEALMEAAQEKQTSEAEFDIGLLLDQIPLPYQALKQWEKVVRVEKSPKWRHEAEKKLGDRQQRLQSWQRLKEDITVSPESYLHNSSRTGKSIELVLAVAVEEWLPKASVSEAARAALIQLSEILRTEYKDLWLKDLLESPVSDHLTRALTALAEASKANSGGEHIRAKAAASRAEGLFLELHNDAGILRSLFEQSYALDRLERPNECIKILSPIHHGAHSRSYVWIEGQARLEEVTCQSETRQVDVTESRQQAYEWISKSGYEGLRLRALSFLTEAYASFDQRLQIWRRGREGLLSFWNDPLPPLRGYTFYYTMASSAKSAGDLLVAVAFLREGTTILENSPHRQMLALVLSDLGAWEQEARLQQDGNGAFARMEKVFEELDKSKVQKFWREAEITHAEAELAGGQPKNALSHLNTLTQSIAFPYEAFSPTARRRLLVALGNTYLTLGNLNHASECYVQVISDSERTLSHVRNRSQRSNTLLEVGLAWRGLAEILLRWGSPIEALDLWEDFRSGRATIWQWRHKQPGNNTSKQMGQTPDRTFLVYAFLPGGISAWLVTASGTEHHWIDEKLVRAEALRFSALVADPESPLATVQEISRRLYASLVQPFGDRIPHEGSLIIDADGPLASIPWSALEDSAGGLLLDRLAISQVSGWVEAQSSFQQDTIQKNPLILGQPLLRGELAKEYPRLPDLQAGEEELHRILPQALYFPGPDATIGALASHISDATLFHFAGHGIGYGEFGGLLLAPSNGDKQPATFFTANEIANLKLSRLQLVVLAACSSGEGEQIGTVNLDSLTRAFLESGAKRVVAARWNVNSGQTKDLMSRFYELVFQRTPPSEALRQSAREIRQNFVHPYYWAGFQVFGSP